MEIKARKNNEQFKAIKNCIGEVVELHGEYYLVTSICSYTITGEEMMIVNVSTGKCDYEVKDHVVRRVKCHLQLDE